MAFAIGLVYPRHRKAIHLGTSRLKLLARLGKRILLRLKLEEGYRIAAIASNDHWPSLRSWAGSRDEAHQGGDNNTTGEGKTRGSFHA